MSGRRGLVVPQNTFLDSIIKRTHGTHEHFLLASAQIMDAPIVYCSDGFTKLTGYKKSHVVKKKANCSFMYGSLTTKDDVRSLRNAIQEKQTAQIEILLYKRDGTPFWALLNIALVSDDMNDSVLYLLTFQDITEFKEPINPSYRKHRWTEFNRALHSKPLPDNPISKAKEERNQAHIAQLKEDDVDILPEYKQEIPKTPRCVILHCSTPKIVWDWFILIFILYTATSVPFIVCFKFDSFPMTIADTFVDFMFLVDILFNLHTSYVGDDGTIVFDLKLIRRNYYRSWFFVDLVTSMPYGLLGLLISDGVGRGITDLISFLKAVRLLRLNRVVRALDQYLEYGFITLILWMLFFCLCAHWMACIFFAIADHYDNFADIGWVRSMSEQTQQPLLIINGTVVETPTLASLYMSSLYFSLTSLTSIGFGNIAPNTTAEKIFSCVTMIFGGLCYAVIFGQVTAIVQQSQKKSESYHQTLDNMRSFCKLYNIPKDISTRIVDYYMYTWVLNRGVDTNQVLTNCPKDLQSDICIHLNRKIIDGTPAFGELSNAVLRAVARNFAIHRVAPGERVVHEGESLDTLFFIGSGSFEVTQKGKVVGLLGEGDVFGDDVCRFNDVGRSAADVFALTYADVHAIGRDELLGALAFYPEYGIQFAKVFRLSYNLRDEVTMRKLSSHPRAKSHLIPREMEGRRYSLVEEMQQHADETDSNSFDLGTPNSQNMTDTDPPSKPLIRVNKPRLSNGNVMEGIPEDGEDETNMGDDEDFKRWNEYQNSRDMSEGLLNEITGMKSDVRREIEVMGSKMNQLEQNIATMLRLLRDHGLKSPGSGFNTTLDPVTPPRTHSRTASIICRVKAEIPEEVLPEWVEMENFGMAGFPKDDGTVNSDVKVEKEEESLQKKIGGRITNKRQRLAKRKKKKAEKASNNKNESEDEDEERENVAAHDLIDQPPAPKEGNEYVEEEKKDISERAETISINEDLQDSLQPADEEDPGRLSSSIQRGPQNEKGKKKRKKKKGEKTSKRENESNKDEEETEAGDEESPKPDTPRVDSPRAGSSEKNSEKSHENDKEQSLAESNERASSPAEESAVPDEQRPSSRADTPRKNFARSEHGEPEENTVSSERNSTSGRQPPSGGNSPRAQSPERHSDDENEQENKQGPSTLEVDPERNSESELEEQRPTSPEKTSSGRDCRQGAPDPEKNSESELEEQRPTSPEKTSSGRDCRQGAPGDVALKIEDSDDGDFLVTK